MKEYKIIIKDSGSDVELEPDFSMPESLYERIKRVVVEFAAERKEGWK